MSRFTIDNVIKTLFPYDSQNNNPYDEEILILEDHLKNISDNKKKIDYLNYFLEKNESKILNDLFSFYLKWEGIPEDKKYFIDKIKKDEGLLSFITRITKEDDYDGYRNFFIQYILIYERILYDMKNNTPATVSQTKEQEGEKGKRNTTHESITRKEHVNFKNSERVRILELACKAYKARYNSIDSIQNDGKIDVNKHFDALSLETLLNFPEIESGQNIRMADYFTIKGKETNNKDWSSPRERFNQRKTKLLNDFKKEIGLEK